MRDWRRDLIRKDLTVISHVSFSVMKKRRADEMSDEVPSAKMRRLVGLSNENAASSSASATFASSYDDYVSGNIFFADINHVL